MMRQLRVKNKRKRLNAYVMPQCCLRSSFGASLALGEADGVSGPVIHQLMQVISEGAFALLGERSWRGGPSRLGQGGGVVLAVS